MRKLFVITFICLTGCSEQSNKQNKYSDIILNAEEMQIAFSTGSFSTSVVSEKDRSVFLALNDVFSGNAQDCDCQHSGYIAIYSQKKVVLDVWLATSATGSGENCQFLIMKEENKNKCYKLNYRLGRYLDELFYDIKPR